ncbi:MAG: immune inhibitor A [Bacteroidetes bacterium]|nr:immune inhibitor A [Bacteroidota bacterium]MCL5026986.1 immune inhibitor A [Chloroflexota bacterium]
MRRLSEVAAALLLVLVALAAGAQLQMAQAPVHLEEPVAVATADASPTGSTAPASQIELLRRPLPARDLADLDRRLHPSLSVDTSQVSPRPALSIGEQETLWATDFDAHKFITLTAEVAQLSPHARFYLQNGERASASAWDSSVKAFESQTYPALRRYLGARDDDPPIDVLAARIPGVRGYFNSIDQYSREVVPWSNGRPMVYLNSSAVQPGTAGFDGTLAHEAAHLLHYRLRGADDTWVSEGTAELMARLAGYANSGGDRAFRSRPDTQLTAWAAQPSASLAHYGNAYLFLSYFLPHFGGYDSLPDLLLTPGRGTARFDAYLAQRGYSATFDQVLVDWTVANYLNDPGAADGRFAYADLSFRLAPGEPAPPPVNTEGTVHQYAAAYHELALGNKPYTVYFTGTATVPLIDNDPHSGQYQWWSNRGDAVDTRLTREFDLTGVSGTASLEFWAWYDLEDGFDYAFVEASADGGQTWETLAGPHTTTANPMGANLGNGYTGVSGGGPRPAWVDETIDLTAYAGKRVLLRFEQVTDDAYNGQGFAIDDMSIPGIGFADDGERDAGWQAEGFLRIENQVPQDYGVRVIERGQPARVLELPLSAERTGRLTLRPESGDTGQATLVVAPTAPVTTVPARYELAVVPGE